MQVGSARPGRAALAAGAFPAFCRIGNNARGAGEARWI
jgi:hypothetical protein